MQCWQNSQVPSPNSANGAVVLQDNSVTFVKVDKTTFPKFRAYLNTAQTGSNNAVIKLDTKSYDTHNAFNTTTWRYVIPVAGSYSFSWNIQTATGTSVLSALSVNGTSTSRGSWVTNASSFIGSSGSDTLPLNVGDYVQLFCAQMGGTATTDAGSALTYMSGHLVP